MKKTQKHRRKTKLRADRTRRKITTGPPAGKGDCGDVQVCCPNLEPSAAIRRQGTATGPRGVAARGAIPYDPFLHPVTIFLRFLSVRSLVLSGLALLA